MALYKPLGFILPWLSPRFFPLCNPVSRPSTLNLTVKVPQRFMHGISPLCSIESIARIDHPPKPFLPTGNELIQVIGDAAADLPVRGVVKFIRGYDACIGSARRQFTE
jgi:hypothetical protein